MFKKQRYQEKDQHFALSLDEIFEELSSSSLGDIPPSKLKQVKLSLDNDVRFCLVFKTKSVLINFFLYLKVLVGNPRLEVRQEPGEPKKYIFKPPFALRDYKRGRDLVKLLEKHYENALGGIPYDEIAESLPTPNPEKALDKLIEVK